MRTLPAVTVFVIALAVLHGQINANDALTLATLVVITFVI